MSNTAYVVAKEQSIGEILSYLIPQGYSKDESRKKQFVERLRDSLGTITTWNPDIFLVHKNGAILVADVQLLEERRSQYIPVPMEQAVPKIGSSIGPVKVVLYIPMGGVLDPQTIQKAATLNLAIGAVDRVKGICRILEPSVVCKVFEVDAGEKQVIKRQIDSGWVIPRVLVQKLRKVKNLEYSDYLKQFAIDYFCTQTPVRLSVQYKLASQCIENIFVSKYGLHLCRKRLQISRDLQKMARRKGESRDHFLHEFQTFLMGALVLDSCLESRLSPFVLCNRYPRMDLPWLIASMFHDFGFDLANLESCIDVATGQFRYEPRVNLRYSALLNSFYDFQKNDGDLDDWDPNSHVVKSYELQNILFRAAKEESETVTRERLRANHGVLSAHEITDLEERLSGEKPGLAPIFLSSALSASMHDKRLWAELFSNSIFPTDASRFPLLYLLVLCDTLAEAGRPRKTEIRQQDAVLTSFDVRDRAIHLEVYFSNPERACTMNYWSRFVQERCFTNPLLELRWRSLS